MNILVLGNGFDLAHGLPTKYMEFLKFTEAFMYCYQKADEIDWVNYNTNNEINVFLKKMFSARYENENGQMKAERDATRKLIEELKNCIDNNFWIDYFLQCDMHGNENWIDFESEISELIKSLDTDMHKLSGDYSIDDDIMDLSNKYLNNIYSDYTFTTRSVNSVTGGSCESITFRKIRDRLLGDLNRLIRAFEIYLTEYVEKIDCNLVSPDIQGIIPKETMKINGMPVYDTYVLSFNYTNTYQRIYIDKIQEKKYFEKSIDYIHGKTDIHNTIESNNMVLGIDEYLSDERKNKDIEFIAFKKYYQRIHKQTGCKYKNWVDRIRQDYFELTQKLEDAEYMKRRYIPDSTQRMFNKLTISALKGEKCPKHNLYIFGHSLDATDKDILQDLILNDNVKTTIFYHNKDVMGQQIANLVKIIGQDELIKRTGGSTKTIEFKQQQDMVSI